MNVAAYSRVMLLIGETPDGKVHLFTPWFLLTKNEFLKKTSDLGKGRRPELKSEVLMKIIPVEEKY